MAQITVDFARRIIDASERDEHTPLTAWEENQLAYAWLCLHMLRGLVEDGEAEAAVALLGDAKALAAAFCAQFREDPSDV